MRKSINCRKIDILTLTLLTAVLVAAALCLHGCAGDNGPDVNDPTSAPASATAGTGDATPGWEDPLATDAYPTSGVNDPTASSGTTKTDDPSEIGIDTTPTARVTEVPVETATPDSGQHGSTPTAGPSSTGVPGTDAPASDVPATQTPEPTKDPQEEYVGLAGLTYTQVQYVRSGSELKQIDDILFANVDRSLPAQEQIRQIHEWMVRNIAFDSTLKSLHLRSLLETGKSTSQGYAELFHVFMTELGIPVQFLSGKVGGSTHYWNAVNLGNAWYYVDSMLGDALVGGHSDYPDGSNLTFKYFLVTESEIGRDHSPDTELPAPAGQTMEYHDQAVAAAKAEVIAKLSAAIASGEVENGFIINGPEQVETRLLELEQGVETAGMRRVVPFKFTVYIIEGSGDSKELSRKFAAALTDVATEAYLHKASCSITVVPGDLYYTLFGEIVL
jgi:hypothetical protein